jgi:hypothetical protein
MRKIILYIVYGHDQGYYDGAKFSLITFMHWVKNNDEYEFCILTEKPELFSNYPINLIRMTQEQKKSWSLNYSYHFRIKNRGLAFVMDKLNLSPKDKILFLDTDTYFFKSPLRLFDLITANQAVFYLNEGLIYKRKRFKVYIEHLEGKKIKIDSNYYELSESSALWGSLMVGIMPNMRSNLDWADELMVKLFELVPSHTIEPFSLSESLLKDFNIVEGKHLVSLYSTSRKKEYVVNVLSSFFSRFQNLSIDLQIALAQELKLKRPFYVVIKQRLSQLMN